MIFSQILPGATVFLDANTLIYHFSNLRPALRIALPCLYNGIPRNPKMTRMTLNTRVGADGVLHVPLGEKEANRDVRVIIEPTSSSNPKSRQEYLDFLQATAGAWQGDFERPEQGPYETRDPMG